MGLLFPRAIKSPVFLPSVREKRFLTLDRPLLRLRPLTLSKDKQAKLGVLLANSRLRLCLASKDGSVMMGGVKSWGCGSEVFSF